MRVSCSAMIQCNTRFVSVRSRACTKGNSERIFIMQSFLMQSADTHITQSTSCTRWTVLWIHKPYVFLLFLCHCLFHFNRLIAFSHLYAFVVCHTCHRLRVGYSMIPSPFLRYFFFHFVTSKFSIDWFQCSWYYAHIAQRKRRFPHNFCRLSLLISVRKSVNTFLF